MQLEYRLSSLSDVAALEVLIPASVRALQRDHYSSAQIEGAIGSVFGVDRQLIRDGTYFVATAGDELVGCGGWSRRRSRYGSDRDRTTEDPLRDPLREPAMIRAFFVHPGFARRGIGRRLLALAEEAAAHAGFRELETIATLPGVPLYSALQYEPVESFTIPLGNGASMPVVRMRKPLPLLHP